MIAGYLLGNRGSTYSWRQRLIRSAALIVAAIESFDRKENKE